MGLPDFGHGIRTTRPGRGFRRSYAKARPPSVTASCGYAARSHVGEPPINPIARLRGAPKLVIAAHHQTSSSRRITKPRHRGASPNLVIAAHHQTSSSRRKPGPSDFRVAQRNAMTLGPGYRFAISE
jgi:hypothetical protein